MPKPVEQYRAKIGTAIAGLTPVGSVALETHPDAPANRDGSFGHW